MQLALHRFTYLSEIGIGGGKSQTNHCEWHMLACRPIGDEVVATMLFECRTQDGPCSITASVFFYVVHCLQSYASTWEGMQN